MDEQWQRGTSYGGGYYSYDRARIFEESNFANTDLVERWGEGGIMRSRRRKGVCKDGVCKGVVRFFQSGKAVGIRERGLEEWPIGSEGLVRDRNGSGVVGGIGWVKIL